ncbi:MAG: sn-glycerol-1-phosphate dehydrogenase [Thermofilaceae archaeon]
MVEGKPIHEIELPAKVIVGSGALKQLPPLLGSFAYEKVVVFTGPHVGPRVGFSVAELLLREEFEVHTGVIEGSDREGLEKARGLVQSIRPDVAIAVGGGRVIDVTKYVAYIFNIPFVSVPTSVSHDGIASPAVSLKDVNGYPISKFVKPPIAIVADIDVIAQAPRRLLASGFGDIIGKFTSVRDAILARKIKGEYVGDYSLALARMSASMVAKNAEAIARQEPEGISILVEAAISCGVAMAIAGSSRPCSGSEHAFSHALDIVYPEKQSLHGEQVGVGTIMMAYLHGIDWRRIRRLLRVVGAPTNCEELGVPPKAIIEALKLAHKVRDRYTILGEGGLSESAAWKLAKTTGVIP